MSSNKSRRKAGKQQNVIDMQQYHNAMAQQEGPTRKTWSIHDLKTVKPLTPNQEIVFHDFFSGDNVCIHGSAGTGKTFCAAYLALAEMLDKDSPIDKIVIVRSAVPARDIGFLPGTLEEKIAVYEQPYIDIFSELLGRPASYQNMKAARKVEFYTTSYLRGLTWDDTIVIVDEAQNMTMTEIDSIMTRLGCNTRIILCGDTKYQQDLRRENTGIHQLVKVAERMAGFSVVEFTVEDIVRSNLVKQWIMARESVS